MKGYSNERIEDFLRIISDKDKYYANYSEKAFLKNYDKCDDFVLTDVLISSVWEELKKHFSSLNKITLVQTPVSILHTNSGTGKVLEACPSDNVFITAMNNDYTCKRICDLLNDRVSSEFSYSSLISDISHYFINGDDGNTPRYDIVFTQPTESSYYKDIDSTRIASYDWLEYYSIRSLDFLTKGGYLCIMVHPRKFDVLKNNKEFSSEVHHLHSIIPSQKLDEYGCLIFKKI